MNVEIWAHHDSTRLGIPLTGVKAKFYRSKNNQYISMFPWIEDSDFFPILEHDNGNPDPYNFSQVVDGLQQWIRWDRRVDVPTIHQWNAAFDRYMRNKFCQTFPMHTVMARQMADLSVSLNSAFTHNRILIWQLNREIATTAWYKAIHTSTIDQFSTYKELARRDLQIQIIKNAECRQNIFDLSNELANERKLHRMALSRIEELDANRSAEECMGLSSSYDGKRRRTSREPESSRDSEHPAGSSRNIPAENADGLAPTGVLRRSLRRKSKRFAPYSK